LRLELTDWSSSEPVLPSTNPPPTSVPTGTDIIPTQTNPSNPSTTTPPVSISSISSSVPSFSPHGQNLTNSYTTFTTSYPVVISQSFTTFTSYSTSIVTTTTAVAVSQTPSSQSNFGMNSICIGNGVDSVSFGLLAVALLSALVGFIVWVRPSTGL
jgi:hypothetical protein